MRELSAGPCPKAVSGHFPFFNMCGVLDGKEQQDKTAPPKIGSCRNPVYVTFVRDIVSRVRSHFAFVRQERVHHWPEMLNKVFGGDQDRFRAWREEDFEESVLAGSKSVLAKWDETTVGKNE